MFARARNLGSSLIFPLTVSIVFVLGACGALYLREANAIASNTRDLENRRMERFASVFGDEIDKMITDLRVMASGDGFQEYLTTGQTSDYERAVHRALFFSKDNTDYDKIRYIDEKGQEIFRLNHDGAIVPHDQLQNKADRSFFQKANVLNPGEIFVSAIDLNVENGAIEQPIKPTVRVATPVFDASGRRRGIYIINYLAANGIEHLRQFVPRYAQRFRMLDAQGYWLAGAKPEDEWGFELPGRSGLTMAKTDPELWAKILKEPRGQEPYKGGYFTWVRAAPRDFDPDKPLKLVAEEDFLVFASQLSAEEWNASFAGLRQTFVVVGLLLLVLATAVSWAYQARRRTQQERDRFFSLSNDLFCIAGFDGHFKSLNPAWVKTFGYTTEELRSKPFESFLHPDDLDKTREQFARQKGGQGVVSFENRYRCKDGSYRWLLWNAHPLVEEQLIFASARDMTERKQIDEKLQQSEERLRLMVESVRDYAIFMLDPTGRIVSWNAGAERIEGYTAEEIVGRHFSVFYPEEKRRERFPEQELAEAAAKGRAEDEGWRVRKDGSQFWANVVITAMHDSQGKLLGFVKVARDVSLRRQAEDALLKSQQMFEGLFENSPDAIILVNQAGRIVRVNAQIDALFGYTRNELEGQSVETLMPERYRMHHGRDLANYFAAPRTRAMGAGLELFARRKDGSEFPVDIMLSPLKTEEGDHALAVIRDITNRKQAAEKIQKLNEELKQRADLLEVANKELESFSYSVSHDLRAPLRHIHGFVEMLQKSPALEKEASAHRYMEVISKAARQMGLLIDDLLAFSRTGRAEINPVKIKMREMVDQVIRDFEIDCKDRKIAWDIQPLSAAPGDPVLIRLVWVNLLANAIKYTRTRAEAKIEVGELDGANKNSGGHEDEVVYYIRDNGVGFDMRYAAKLFGVFQRLHRAEDFEGTGIGLANVQRIIHRHGGRVWADGKVEAGATFYFSLPVKPTIQPK